MPKPRWTKQIVPISWVLLAAGLALASSNAGFEQAALLLAVGTVEAAVVFFALRPSTFAYHGGRALAAVIFVLVTSTIWAARAEPLPGPAYIVHLFWLLGLTVALCALLGYSLFQRTLSRPR